MKQKELNSKYYLYGNKGAVWSNKVHIAKSGQMGTLCGTPMLSSNWARIEDIDHAGCPNCLLAYANAEGIGPYGDESIEEHADMIWRIRFGY